MRNEKHPSEPLEFGVTFHITGEHISELAAETADLARMFIENTAVIEREKGNAVSSAAVDESVSIFKTQAKKYLSENLVDDLTKFLSQILVIFAHEEKNAALLAALMENASDLEGGAATVRVTQRMLMSNQRQIDSFILGLRHTLPRGATPGQRSPEFNELLRSEYRELREKSGGKIRKAGALQILGRRHNLSPHSIDARIWPRQRKPGVKKIQPN